MLMVNTEHPTSDIQLPTSSGRAKSLQANVECRMQNADKPDKATQSHSNATPKPTDSQRIATPKPPQGSTKAPPRLPQSHHQANYKPYATEELRKSVRRSCDTHATPKPGRSAGQARRLGGYPAGIRRSSLVLLRQTRWRYGVSSDPMPRFDSAGLAGIQVRSHFSMRPVPRAGCRPL